jgi:O-antigen/teichoic acid export membrane protein
MEGKKEISIRLFSILTEISFIPLIIVVLLGQEIFLLLLGSNWSEAGLYAQVLSISVFVRFIFAPSPYLLILLEKQQYQLYFNIILTIITILSLAIGYLFKEIIISLVLISFLSAALHVFMGCYMFKLIGIKFIEIIKPFIKVFPIVLLVILILFLSKIVFSFDNFILIIIACIIMISYMFYVVYTNKYLLGALKRAF